MNNSIIIHISEVEISPDTGMGRIEYYWKEAFEKKGFTFIHIGPKEIGPMRHPAFFPYKAYKYYKKLKLLPKAFIVHEPAAGYFVKRGIPCFIESHGIERRYWEAQLNGSVSPEKSLISFKTRILLPLWRLRGCDRGLKNADRLLLSNSDDKDYAKTTYKRRSHDILIFKNGVNSISVLNNGITDSNFTILFNASWLERKGIHVLIKAAQKLYNLGLKIHYLLIGTGMNADVVLNDWPKELKPFVNIVSSFPANEEINFLNSVSLFVLPSYFEGQPLSLLQAMAAGKCCITTNCCGQKDIINNGKTGFLFSVGDYEELAQIINRCYADRLLMKNIGDNAKQFVEKLSWEKVSDEVADFILNK